MQNHTFVIPAYKESPFLRNCVTSLKNQNVESKIIITTSTPSAYIENIAKEYSIEYYINDSSEKGIGSDWNFALTKCNTKFVTIAHQDDLYERNYAEAIMNSIEKTGNKNIILLFTDYNDLLESHSRTFSLNYIVKKILLSPFILSSTIQHKLSKRSILLFGNPICCPSVTFNKEALYNYSFSTEYKFVLDWYA